jgi:hypothetical protein
MVTKRITSDAPRRTTVPLDEQPRIASCRLDVKELRGQRERYRKLADQVLEIRREPETLSVSFMPELDSALLEKTIAIEKDCCPLFTFDYSPRNRALTIGVIGSEHREALDALAYALKGQAG